MSDLISRQAAIDAICEHGTDLERRGVTVLAVANHKQVTVDLLEQLPSVQPLKGKWILDNPHSEIYRYACSECHAHHRARYDFCPSCGCRMEEGDSE